MNVVIVESAAKAKTINKYLGSGYKVIPSFGHVRDLPSKNGSVEPENDFEMHWDVDSKSQKIIREITAAVKGADKLILATDPDREGEAISWHILQILEKKRALKKNLEVERVGEALGIALRVPLERRMAGAERVGHHKTSMLQDVEHRRTTECDAILGAPLETAALVQVETPNLRALHGALELLTAPFATNRV